MIGYKPKSCVWEKKIGCKGCRYAADQQKAGSTTTRGASAQEQHLHLMDVREAKSRIDRVDGYRRVARVTLVIVASKTDG